MGTDGKAILVLLPSHTQHSPDGSKHSLSTAADLDFPFCSSLNYGLQWLCISAVSRTRFGFEICI